MSSSPFDWLNTVEPLILDQPFLNKNRNYLFRCRLIGPGNIFNGLPKIGEEVADSSSESGLRLKLIKVSWQHIGRIRALQRVTYIESNKSPNPSFLDGS